MKLATPAFVRRLPTDERVSAEEVHGLRQEVPALSRSAALNGSMSDEGSRASTEATPSRSELTVSSTWERETQREKGGDGRWRLHHADCVDAMLNTCMMVVANIRPQHFQRVPYENIILK